MRILIADDELVSRKKITAILRNYGHCTCTSNGKAALEVVSQGWEEQAPYDLFFLDIDMPNMDGMSVLREIRNMENRRNVPAEKKIKVIMVTAHNNRDTIIQCLREGCNDYILKPVKKEMIAKKIARFLPQENDAAPLMEEFPPV